MEMRRVLAGGLPFSTALDGEVSWLVEFTLTALGKPTQNLVTACCKSARTQIQMLVQVWFGSASV